MRVLCILILALSTSYASRGQQSATATQPNGFTIVDGVTFLSVQAAIDAFSGSPGIVIVPSSYKGSSPSHLPDNVAIWDFRDRGRFKIMTTPSENTAGSAAGLWIAAGPLGFTSDNPAANNIVGLYTAVRSTGGRDTWGSNFAVDLAEDKPDANLWGSEIEITYAIFRTFEEGWVWLVKQRA